MAADAFPMSCERHSGERVSRYRKEAEIQRKSTMVIVEYPATSVAERRLRQLILTAHVARNEPVSHYRRLGSKRPSLMEKSMSDRNNSASAVNQPATSGHPGINDDTNKGMSDEDAQKALDHGDNQKIDKVLDEIDVSTTASGKDQTAKPDTEGSNSSSKNLDEQSDR